ncbi:MAG: glutamine-hydrolyzing carbamoyl-phosphate synthase small subunit [Pseudomonadota bacterium]
MSDNVSLIEAIQGKRQKTAVICFADGTVLHGYGFGKTGHNVAEICFNTALTGYQEVLSDPSYASQFVTFTFPHIGNVGTTPEDLEAQKCFAAGLICREDITNPSNWRATNHFSRWAAQNDLIGICGIDTRALTALIRDHGMPHAVIAHQPDGQFDIENLIQQAKDWPGLEGLDLAAKVTCTEPYHFTEGRWTLKNSFQTPEHRPYKVVAVDFGVKKNILRCLTDAGCDVTIVPAGSSYETIMSYDPDGIFLSNGPGDPAATGEYAVPVVQKLLESNLPIFGICLGHQILALALGAKTYKMKFGHHGANHPVQNIATKKVEITSMNHGFTVDTDTLPADVTETHKSLFDGSNCGIAVRGKPVYSVQFHPEASPGPQDSYYLFEEFAEAMAEYKQKNAA